MIPIVSFIILTIFSVSFISLPFFKKLDEHPTSQKRVNTLDGLRGFLAFSVLVCHLDVNMLDVTKGMWGNSNVFSSMLGYVGVALFFMMTAFLFWGKMLSSNGTTNWIILYINRFFRIAPVYYIMVALGVFVAFFVSDFKLIASPKELSFSLFKWMFIGLWNFPVVNKFETMRILGVTWTLRYEWVFYFSLFFSSIFIRKNWVVPFLIINLIASFAYTEIIHPNHATWALFSLGMVCVTLIRRGGVKFGNQNFNSLLAISCLVLVFSIFSNAAGIIQLILLFIFFYLVSNGTSLFGLLELRGSRRFGNISYSLYLFHMVFMYMFYKIPFIRAISSQSQVAFWGFSIICIAIIIVVSSVCYYHIEKNGIEWGKKFTKKVFSSSYFPAKYLKT